MLPSPDIASLITPAVPPDQNAIQGIQTTSLAFKSLLAHAAKASRTMLRLSEKRIRGQTPVTGIESVTQKVLVAARTAKSPPLPTPLRLPPPPQSVPTRTLPPPPDRGPSCPSPTPARLLLSAETPALPPVGSNDVGGQGKMSAKDTVQFPMDTGGDLPSISTMSIVATTPPRPSSGEGGQQSSRSEKGDGTAERFGRTEKDGEGWALGTAVSHGPQTATTVGMLLGVRKHSTADARTGMQAAPVQSLSEFLVSNKKKPINDIQPAAEQTPAAPLPMFVAAPAEHPLMQELRGTGTPVSSALQARLPMRIRGSLFASERQPSSQSSRKSVLSGAQGMRATVAAATEFATRGAQRRITVSREDPMQNMGLLGRAAPLAHPGQ